MEFKKEFELAQEVIKDAGEIMLAQIANSHKISRKIDSSIVTQVDKTIERFIQKRLMSISSAYGFIGEEGKEIQKEIAWIVDPLDGTVAFTRQIPEFGIAIAFKKDQEIIFSVQYIPSTDRLLTAYNNKGAYCNEKKISIGQVQDLHDAIVSFGVRHLWQKAFQDYTLELVKNSRFRVGHSAVVESYYLASGKTDIFLRFEQPIYDVAAEYLLMKEAGAIITNEYGKPLHLHFSKEAKHNVVATNPFINKNYKDQLYFKNLFK